MEHEVHLVERPPLLVISKRMPVALEAIGGTLGGAFGEVYGFLGTTRVAPAGPPFVIYHSMPEPGTPLDIEICAPVAAPVDAPTPWSLVELPGGTFVSRMHVGPYDTVGTTYDALIAWIPAHDLEIAGPPREVYLSDPSTPPEQVHTIVEFPVVKVAAPVG